MPDPIILRQSSLPMYGSELIFFTYVCPSRGKSKQFMMLI